MAELAASQFAVCTVRSGFCDFEGTVGIECEMKEMKISVAIETQKTLIVSILIK